MDRLKNLLSTHPHARILDVATGSGQFLDLLTQTGAVISEAVGVDLSLGALEAGRQRFVDRPFVRFEQMEAGALQYPSASFDVVCLSNSLHHLPHPLAVLREMERVLGPGGSLIFNEMTADGLTPAQWSHRKLHHFAAEVDRELGLFHQPTFRRIEISGWLEHHSRLMYKKSWFLSFSPEGPLSPDDLESILQTLDRQLARLKDSPRLEIMISKAERIRRHIRRHGFASCPQWIVVYEKKSV